MKIKGLFVMLMSLALTACTTGGAGILSNLECGAYTGPVPPCQGNPQTPSVNLNTNTLDVTPRCVKAQKTKTIAIDVVPPAKNDVGSVAIVPKDPTDTWLTGTNSPDKTKINIVVPDWVEPGEYSYGILKSNGDCRDPRVEVTN